MIESLRSTALDFLTLATRGADGVTELDQVYRAVTEGRDPGPVYSSCGDLAHWLWYRLGVRLPFVNRTEHKGWVPQANITGLWKGPWRAPIAHELPQPGDVWVIWRERSAADAAKTGQDAHVLVCERIEGDGELHSFEYGQAAIAKDRWEPGSIEGRSKLTRLSGGAPWLWPDGRRLQRVIPLSSVLERANEAGLLVEAETAVAWLHRALAAYPPKKRPTLREGDRGNFVRELQRTLGGVPVNGIFEGMTAARLRAFQVEHDLKADAVCGDKTWAALTEQHP